VDEPSALTVNDVRVACKFTRWRWFRRHHLDDEKRVIEQRKGSSRLAEHRLALLGADHGARRDASYDVGVDLGKGRYCRIQVKGRERAHHGKWDFRFVRGNPRTGAGTYAYAATDFDITACVSLSLERVAFFPGVQPSIRLTTADFLRADIEIESWTRALSVFNRQH
jgi:hypothetical protein